ncbi:MAG TPA: GNAT family N-acetyltransferase [Nocardioidaceae bacterium]|jgi:phosphinothricin acetyltransferase|nr:GNAT family N-acetyltransferase [Nocardioidaceae bacterium]
MDPDIVIRPAVETDLSDIATIYNHEVATSVATFDLEPPTPTYWQQKLAGNHPGDHLLVAVDGDDDVVGYAYSWSYRPRPAYHLTRETSIYLDPSARGRGIARRLYPALLDTMATSGVHTAVALVAQPNPGSVALHKACGFEHVGTMREVGYKFDRWIDVEWYQKLLTPQDAEQPPIT